MADNMGQLTSIESKIKTGDLKELPEIIKLINEFDDPVIREAFNGAVVKKFKISRKIIKQIAHATNTNTDTKINSMISAHFPELIDLAIDQSGKTVFLTANNLIPEMQMHNAWYDGTVEILPPLVKQIPYLLPRAEEIIKYYIKGDDDKALFYDILKHLNRFCYISHGQAIIITCYVFLTYLQDHVDVNYLAIISLVGEPERGKSRLGKALTFIAYRGVILNGVREAHIIRLAEDYSATIFLDLRTAWKKVIAENADDLILGRYERGHKIMRVVAPEKGAYEDSRYFKSYGPTFLASNDSLGHVLETRTIPLVMENRPGDYEIPREILGQELRERLVAWRARALNDQLPSVDSIGLSGRFWDITQPILRICKQLCPDEYKNLCNELLCMAKEKVELKKDTIEAFIIQSIIALSTISLGDCQMQLNSLLQVLNIGRSPENTLSSQYLGLKLKSMGIKTKHLKGHSWIVLEKKYFDILQKQFGLFAEVESPATATNLNIEGDQI